LKYPGSKEYTNGEKCPSGTPDAGKVGEVSARWWLLSTKTAKNGELEQTGGLTTVHPADLKFADRQLITVGFVPHNVSLPKPPTSTITALLQVLAGGSQPITTTTAPAATSTTAPSATTSSVPASSTSTTAASTTTSSTKPSTTTTTK
jgi:hypothetical protein